MINCDYPKCKAQISYKQAFSAMVKYRDIHARLCEKHQAKKDKEFTLKHTRNLKINKKFI